MSAADDESQFDVDGLDGDDASVGSLDAESRVHDARAARARAPPPPAAARGPMVAAAAAAVASRARARATGGGRGAPLQPAAAAVSPDGSAADDASNETTAGGRPLAQRRRAAASAALPSASGPAWCAAPAAHCLRGVCVCVFVAHAIWECTPPHSRRRCLVKARRRWVSVDLP